MIQKTLIAATLVLVALSAPGAQAATAKLLKSAGTVISANGVVTAVPTGTSVIDTQTIKCAGANGCVISIAAMVQAISGSGSGQWQVCALVDGNLALPGCPVQGIVPSSNYVVGNLRASATVNSGTHTVETEVVMPAAGNIAARESDYTVFKN